MVCKIFVALLLVVPQHFIERAADGWSRDIEHPCAFGAAPAPKTRFFDPYQFAAHGLPCTPRDSVRLCSKDGAALVFSMATATTKPAFALGDVLHKTPLIEHTSKPNGIQ
jgi:hypothetical protein